MQQNKTLGECRGQGYLLPMRAGNMNRIWLYVAMLPLVLFICFLLYHGLTVDPESLGFCLFGVGMTVLILIPLIRRLRMPDGLWNMQYISTETEVTNFFADQRLTLERGRCRAVKVVIPMSNGKGWSEIPYTAYLTDDTDPDVYVGYGGLEAVARFYKAGVVLIPMERA